MLRRGQWAIAAIVGLSLMAGVGAKSSQGAVILVLQASSPTGSGPFTYTYDGSLSSDAQLQTGDYFAIIDFQGYVDGSVFSSNPLIAASVEATTAFPPNQVYPDDPGTVNLRFTYVGTTPTTGPVTDLGDFGAQSIFGVVSSFLFQTASDHKQVSQGSSDYSILAGNTTQVQGPSGVVPVPGVPEPATLGLAASGVLGLALLRRNRRSMG